LREPRRGWDLDRLRVALPTGAARSRFDSDYVRPLRAPHAGDARGGGEEARSLGIRAGTRSWNRGGGIAASLTRCSGCKVGAAKEKGLAAATANPLSRRWLRGLDLNQRPLGYEPIADLHGIQGDTAQFRKDARLLLSAFGPSCRALGPVLR